MNVETLLQMSADRLEKLTDEELKKIFQPYLNRTRKSLSPREVKAARILLAEEDALKQAERHRKMEEITAKLMSKYKGQV